LEGITACSELRGHDRFLPVVQGLSMKDWQLKVIFISADFALNVKVVFIHGIGVYFSLVWQLNLQCRGNAVDELSAVVLWYD
jgi:hypothetical protein